MPPRSPSWWLALVAALLLLAPPWAEGQQLTPFLGQGLPPEGGATVFVTAIVDRMVAVNDQDYRFEVVLYLMLSWNDPRARPAVVNSTQRAATDGGECALPCTSLYRFEKGAPCCDGVWLPHLEFTNARGFSQDRVVRYGIRVPEPNATNPSAVVWWVHVHGEFYTPLSFRAFPFDKQQLLVQLAYSDRTPNIPVSFNESATGLSLYTPRSGDDVSGWKVQSVEMSFYNYPDENLALQDTTFSALEDPWPVHPVLLANGSPVQPQFVGSLWHQGFDILITVQRISLYYIISSILPIALNVWLALLVFSVSPKHLDTRLGICVTLFLALTALLFVVTGGLPESSTVVPVQQACILSYFILGVIGAESILVYRIVTTQRQLDIRSKTRKARMQFLRRLRTIEKELAKGNGAAAAAAAGAEGLRQRRPAPAGDGQPPGSQPGRQTPSEQEPPLPPLAIVVEDPGARQGSAPHAHTLGVHAGGIGVYMESSSDSEPNGSEYESSEPSTPRANGQGAEAAPAWWDVRQLGKHAKGGPSGEPKLAKAPGWFGRQRIKWTQLRKEARRNPHFALWLALRIDFWVMVTLAIGYNLALVLILVIQSFDQLAAKLHNRLVAAPASLLARTLVVNAELAQQAAAAARHPWLAQLAAALRIIGMDLAPAVGDVGQARWQHYLQQTCALSDIKTQQDVP